MKITCALTLASSLLLAHVGIADDTHEADRGLEGSLRAAINERHVHIHVHQGIVTLDGKVPTEADRERIEALVRNTGGVVAVKDKLNVTLPTPGAYGANPSRVPVYATPPPVVAPPATVVSPPAPVLIPDYPKLRVLAFTSGDEPIANRIARQLRTDALPAAGIENVTISVNHAAVSLKGVVTTQQERDALIAAIQRAGGVAAIYDQTQVTRSDDSDF